MKQCSRFFNKEKPCLNLNKDENGFLNESEFAYDKRNGLRSNCKFCSKKDKINNIDKTKLYYELNKKEINEKRNLNKKTINYGINFLEKAPIIHNNKYDYSKVIYKGIHEKVIIICLEHGEFLMTPNHHLNRGQNCPLCILPTKGEAKIMNLLKNKFKLNFKHDFWFNDCRNIKNNLLFFDFYILNLNIIIEYDGELHFELSGYSNAKERYEKTLIHDKIKNKYCKNNNIPLLRIKYTEFNKIEEILTKFINENNKNY